MEASAGSEEFLLQLCLPLIPYYYKAKLQVHVGQHDKIMKIVVCEIDMIISQLLLFIMWSAIALSKSQSTLCLA